MSTLVLWATGTVYYVFSGYNPVHVLYNSSPGGGTPMSLASCSAITLSLLMATASTSFSHVFSGSLATQCVTRANKRSRASPALASMVDREYACLRPTARCVHLAGGNSCLMRRNAALESSRSGSEAAWGLRGRKLIYEAYHWREGELLKVPTNHSNTWLMQLENHSI